MIFEITPPSLGACRLVSACQQFRVKPATVVWQAHPRRGPTFVNNRMLFLDGGPDSYTISGKCRNSACPTGTKGRSGRKRQFPKLYNRRCAASRTSQAFHRRALWPSGEFRKKLPVGGAVRSPRRTQPPTRQRVADQVGEIERTGRLQRFLPPQVADLIVASGTKKKLANHADVPELRIISTMKCGRERPIAT